MSNRNERNRLRTTRRLTKAFGEHAHITWHKHKACISFPVESQVEGYSIDVLVMKQGNTWHMDSARLSLNWVGESLTTGAKIVKTLLLLGV